MQRRRLPSHPQPSQRFASKILKLDFPSARYWPSLVMIFPGKNLEKRAIPLPYLSPLTRKRCASQSVKFLRTSTKKAQKLGQKIAPAFREMFQTCLAVAMRSPKIFKNSQVLRNLFTPSVLLAMKTPTLAKHRIIPVKLLSTTQTICYPRQVRRSRSRAALQAKKKRLPWAISSNKRPAIKIVCRQLVKKMRLPQKILS